MKTKTKKNSLIKTWQKYFQFWSKKAKEKFHLSDAELKEEIKKHALNQLDLIEEQRPNKELTAKQQANDLQLEYLIWLENVAETGKITDDL